MSRVDETTSGESKVGPELTALLSAGLPPRPLWQRFLQIAQQTLGADAAVLWDVPTETGQPVPLGMCGNPELRDPVAQRNAQQTAHVLQAAATDDTIVHRVETPQDSDADAPPEPLAGRLLVVVPLHTNGDLAGMMEVIQPEDQTADELHERLQQLQREVALVEHSLQASLDASALNDESLWPAFEQFAYNIHRSLVLSEVADTAANDGRQLLKCDRLSVAVQRGQKTSILAVAGQDVVNRRSEDVRSLQKIAEEAVSVGEILEFCPEKEELAPHLRRLFARHIELTAATLVVAVPLFAPARRAPGSDDSDHQPPVRKVVGCLLIELFQQARLEPHRKARLDSVADTLGAALANAREQQQTWLVPTRRQLGKGLDFFRGRLLAKTLLVIGLITAVTVGMLITPWDYRVEAEGRLMPSVQRHVFAPWDGSVVKLSVVNGQRVQQGDLLLTIYNDELHEELVNARNERDEHRQKQIAIKSRLFERAGKYTEREADVELHGELMELEIRIAGLDERIEVLEAREQSLRVTAPIDGVVATFQLEEKLRNRPVSRGEHLLEVMDDQSDWHLELELPEYRMGHLLRAAADAGQQPLPVEYVLATDAGMSYVGELDLVDVATRTEIGRDSEAVVQLKVQTDHEQLPFLRIGGEATARVSCGEKSVAYVLLGDVWEFIQRYAWI